MGFSGEWLNWGLKSSVPIKSLRNSRNLFPALNWYLLSKIFYSRHLWKNIGPWLDIGGHHRGKCPHFIAKGGTLSKTCGLAIPQLYGSHWDQYSIPNWHFQAWSIPFSFPCSLVHKLIFLICWIFSSNSHFICFIFFSDYTIININ